MKWIQLLLDVLSLMVESAGQSEIATTAAWVGVALFVIATIFGKGFGLALLPNYDKVLLVKFFALLAVASGLLLHGHEVPSLVSGLLVLVTVNQVALIWWDRVGRRL